MEKNDTAYTDYNLDFLKEQYIQCNEHLRESDRKRDLLFGVYITITAAYFTFIKDVTGSIDSIYIIVGISLFGSCLGVLFTLYRGWHGIYIITGIIIQNIMSNNKILITENFIKNIDFKFNLISSVELFLFLMINAITIVNTWYCAAHLKNNYTLISVVIFFWLLQFITHFIVMYYLDKLKNTGRLKTKFLWLLQGTIEIK